MTDLEKYEAVNKCETLNELANVIARFSDKEDMIQGRTKKFSASRMANACLHYENRPKNNLTREFGIRQQAMYITYYTHQGI